jgi:hypothetical protein
MFVPWKIPVLWGNETPINLYSEIPMYIWGGNDESMVAIDIKEWTLCCSKNSILDETVALFQPQI